MTILTQDQTAVYNFDNLEGIAIEHDFQVYAYGRQDYYFLGEYESKAMARAVILEFNKCRLAGLDSYYMPPKDFVNYKNGYKDEKEVINNDVE